MNKGGGVNPGNSNPSWHCVMVQTDAKFCVLVTNNDGVRLSIPPSQFLDPPLLRYDWEAELSGTAYRECKQS